MIIFLIIISTLLATVLSFYIRKRRKIDGERREMESEIANAKFNADVAANPQNYFVSEGGTKPDPIPEDENPDNGN